MILRNIVIRKDSNFVVIDTRTTFTMYNAIFISFQVAWMLFDKSAILTVQNHVITRNPRISVSHDKHRTWFLHINDVHEEDKGKYMCQINTAAAKTQYGYLHVVGKALCLCDISIFVTMLKLLNATPLYLRNIIYVIFS